MTVLVGVGPGNIKYLTIEAYERIKAAENIIAFGRISESIRHINENIKVVAKVEDVKDIVKNSDKELVILASGDPCFFGIVDYLKKNEIGLDAVVTGVSSLQYLMSRLKRGWNEVKPLSFHGRAFDSSCIEKGKEYFVLTDKTNSPDSISKRIFKLGFRGSMIIGANLSYEDETIAYKKIGDSIEDYGLSVVVLKIEMD